MRYRYVADVMNNGGPVAANAFRKDASTTGWAFLSDLSPETTLSEYLVNHWLPAVRLEVEPTTFVSYRSGILLYIAPNLGTLGLKDVSKDLLKAFYAHLLTTIPSHRGRPLSKTSVERIHATLHRSFATLVNAGVLDRNPATGARPRRKKSERFEAKTWTHDQLERFLLDTHADPLFPLWRLLAWTGMRRGEALGLQWGDIRFNDACLSIRRTVALADNKIYLSTPKSGLARVIDLDRETVRVLRRFRKELERLTDRRAPLSASDFLFHQNGAPLNPNAISKRFSALVIESGLPTIRLHDLRHTHASHLILSGANPRIVQERLGHADVIITLNTYSHLLPTSQKSALDSLVRSVRNSS
jgi:integrase